MPYKIELRTEMLDDYGQRVTEGEKSGRFPRQFIERGKKTARVYAAVKEFLQPHAEQAFENISDVEAVLAQYPTFMKKQGIYPTEIDRHWNQLTLLPGNTIGFRTSGLPGEVCLAYIIITSK